MARKRALDDDLARRFGRLRATLVIDDRHRDVGHGVTHRNGFGGIGAGVTVDEELADKTAFGRPEAIHQRAVVVKVQLEVPDVACQYAVAFEPDEPDVGKPVVRDRRVHERSTAPRGRA